MEDKKAEGDKDGDFVVAEEIRHDWSRMVPVVIDCKMINAQTKMAYNPIRNRRCIVLIPLLLFFVVVIVISIELIVVFFKKNHATIW